MLTNTLTNTPEGLGLGFLGLRWVVDVETAGLTLLKCIGALRSGRERPWEKLKTACRFRVESSML